MQNFLEFIQADYFNIQFYFLDFYILLFKWNWIGIIYIMKMDKIILLALLICSVFGQKLIKEPTSDDPQVEYLLDANLSTEEWLSQMREILSPSKLSTLGMMINLSGKGPNQLGMYESCNAINDFEYTVISVKILKFKLPIIRIGFWGPKSCDSKENYMVFADTLKDFAVSMTKMSGLYGDVEFPTQENAKPMETGGWIVFMILLIVVLFCIIGIVVGYTNIGNQKDIEINERMKIEDQKTKLALFFYSFNPIVNFQKLFTVKEEGDQRLAVLNGIRVLSIWWVIVGHTFSFIQFFPIVNFSTATDFINGSLFALIPGGLYAVDAFFFLSGFLSFYLLTAKMYPRKGKENFFLLYFHRYYRLIFPIIFITIFGMFLIPYLGDGPYYRTGWEFMIDNCKKYWWTNLLFINNIHPWNNVDECIGWVWYLANDFQFFIMTPPIIYAYCKNRKAGIITIFILIISSMLVNGIITAIYNLSITLSGGGGKIEGGNVLYSKPWARMGAYFVGALFGISYFEYICKEKYYELKDTFSNKVYEKLKNSRVLSLSFAIFGAGLTALYVFPLRNFYVDCNGKDDDCWSRFPNTLYNLTVRPFFVLGIGLVFLPTFVERIRFLKSLFRAKIFTVLARLNYMVYMNHWYVLFWFFNDFRQPLYVTITILLCKELILIKGQSPRQGGFPRAILNRGEFKYSGTQKMSPYAKNMNPSQKIWTHRKNNEP